MTVLKLSKCLFASGLGQKNVMERRNNSGENEVEALISLFPLNRKLLIPSVMALSV